MSEDDKNGPCRARTDDPLIKSESDASCKLLLAITSGNAPMRLDRALTIVAQNDPDLASIIDAWPALPQALRSGILAMVDAARSG